MTGENLSAIAQDGRWGLLHSGKKYSLISIDAYRPPYIPWHLTTREFFEIVYNHLDPNGVMVLNVGRSPDDEKLLSGLVATIHGVFPSVYVIDVPGTYNSIVYATVKTTDESNLENNLTVLLEKNSSDPILIDAIRVTLENLRPLPTGGQVFTDDNAPIEWITNQMVLNNILNTPEFLTENTQ
jgi:spermidine synthase